jgi:hypothetical protein
VRGRRHVKWLDGPEHAQCEESEESDLLSSAYIPRLCFTEGTTVARVRNVAIGALAGMNSR